MTPLAFYFPSLECFAPDYMVMAVSSALGILLLRKSTFWGTVYCCMVGPFLVSLFINCLDDARTKHLEESELISHTPQIYKVFNELFVSLDQDKNGQLDKVEIFNRDSYDLKNDETIEIVQKNIRKIASLKIIQGRVHYEYTIDRRDLEKLKAWAISKLP